MKAAKILEKELVPDAQLHDASPQYKASLAQNLLYKVGKSPPVYSLCVIVHDIISFTFKMY